MSDHAPTERPRVLHVVNDLTTGGAQTLIEALSVDRTAGTFVFVLMSRGVLSERIERVVSEVRYANISTKTPNLIRVTRELKRFAKERRIDVVHSHLMQSDLVSALSRHGRKRISTVHTSGGHESGAVSKLVSAIVPRLSRRFDAVVACSPSALGYAERVGYYSPGLIKVIRNGVTVPPKVAARDAISPTLTILCLSRWHPMKDHRTLLEALTAHWTRSVPVRVILAGSGMDTDNRELLGLLRECGGTERIDLRGAVSDVAALFRESDVLVIPSAYGEALPMAGVEALAHGLPVVATDVGDCRELAIEPWMSVPAGDPQALAAVLMCFQPDARSSGQRDWADSARRLALARFDVRAVRRRYEQLYSDLAY